MNKLNKSGADNLKELWSYAVSRWCVCKRNLRQYAVLRWCVYQTPLLVFGFLLKGGVFDFRYSLYLKSWVKYNDAYEIFGWDLGNIATLIWILILILPAVWVWRKPIWKAIGFLNKKAEEG